MPLISSCLENRQPAPSDVLDWQNIMSWKDVVWGFMGDVFNDPVIRQFQKTSLDFLDSEDLAWLDAIIYSVTGKIVDIHELLAHRLQEKYRAIRTYHGTRVEAVEKIYQEGLEPLNTIEFQKKLRDVFPVDAAGDNLSKAVADTPVTTRKGLVYFEGIEQNHTNRCGHYLIYGSEYLYCLAIRIPNAEKNKQKLKTFGQPTLFQCDVPIEMISENQFKVFAGMAIVAILSSFRPDFEGYSICDDFAGFFIERPLPPEAIVGHYHPPKVRDPFSWEWKYLDEAGISYL